jgi:hypothetical protein
MKQLSIELHRPVQHDDRVGGAVAVGPGPETCGIANQVVLGAGLRIFIEQPQSDRTVVDLGLGLPEIQRGQIVKEKCGRCVQIASSPLPVTPSIVASRCSSPAATVRIARATPDGSSGTGQLFM